MAKIRSFWRQFTFFFRDSFASRGHRRRVDDSLARTIKETTHVAGRGPHSAATQRHLDLAEGTHEDYVASFER